MPIAPRAEDHATGHVLPPEAHWFADNATTQIMPACICRDGEPERSGTDDDERLGRLYRTASADDAACSHDDLRPSQGGRTVPPPS
jgi:hypothetical protein